MSRNKVTRRDALMMGGSATAVAAIFGGGFLDEKDYPGILKVQPVFGVQFGRCGGTHICLPGQTTGQGVIITAGHCVTDDEKITDIRIHGTPVARVGGEVVAFVPSSYERAGLDEDYGYIIDPARRGDPAVPIATEEQFIALRARVDRGEDVMVQAVGYGTTRLDELGRPTEVSERLKGIKVQIVSIDRESIVVRDPKKQGGVCVGDSGSALLIDGVIYAVVSSVQMNPQTGWHCDVEGWTTTYRSLESRREELIDVLAAAEGGLFG